MNATTAAIVIATTAAFVAVAFGIRRLRQLSRAELFGLSREEIRSRWSEIEKTRGQGMMGEKLAVMEADSLLDTVFKSMAMPGNTLGERLRVACARHPELRSVWWAHKLRNQIAHDSSFRMGRGQASRALKEFERALRRLGAM